VLKLNELGIFMRMLQKCNFKIRVCLCLCLLAIVSGCASQRSPASGIPVTAINNAALVSSEIGNAQGNGHVAESKTPENLSTKTVAPVGFAKFLGIFTPYRITIQQGNFVSKEMIAQVKEGMTREQVRFLLGTALLTDMFHSDRWDYIFRLLKPNGESITSRVTVYFHQSLVSRIERGDLPSEREYLARITDAAVVAPNSSTDLP
jgi:outer membrane protein assembly factor BamE